VGFAVMAAYCLTHFPPADALAKIADPALHKIDGGQGLLAVTSFMILGAWTLVDPGFHQRVSAAISPEKGRQGVLISVGLWALFDLMSITVGIYALALSSPLAENSLHIFPVFADQVLPTGVKALFLCGLIGTILSGLVGYTLISGASLGREIVGRIKPELNDDQIGKWTRAGLFIACAVAAVIGMKMQSVVQLWYDWAGLIVGALLLPVSLAYGVLGKAKLGAGWITGSMLVAFTGSFVWLIYGKRTGNEFLEVVIREQKFSLGTLVPALAMSAATLGLGVILRGIKRNG